MLEFIIELDKKILIFINGMNSPIADKVMVAISNKLFWIPFYVILVIYIVAKYRKECIMIISNMVLMIAACDQFASTLCKPFFARLRPCHDSSVNYLLHLAENCGGKYGFISSHAANHFALATFVWLLLRNEYPFVWLMFIWAAIVSYSRVYLGAHFPTDVIAGGLSGILLAFVFFYLYKLIEKKVFKKSL